MSNTESKTCFDRRKSAGVSTAELRSSEQRNSEGTWRKLMGAETPCFILLFLVPLVRSGSALFSRCGAPSWTPTHTFWRKWCPDGRTCQPSVHVSSHLCLFIAYARELRMVGCAGEPWASSAAQTKGKPRAKVVTRPSVCVSVGSLAQHAHQKFRWMCVLGVLLCGLRR